MELVLLGGDWVLGAAVSDARAEDDYTDPRYAPVVLAHSAARFVAVAVHLEPLLVSQPEERKHVAARQGGNERFLWIHARGI